MNYDITIKNNIITHSKEIWGTELELCHQTELKFIFIAINKECIAWKYYTGFIDGCKAMSEGFDYLNSIYQKIDEQNNN